MGSISKETYRELFKNRAFLNYILSKLISRFGDSIDTVAYGYMAFTMTGSAALLAIIYAVNGIPAIIFSLISGVVIGYYPKKKIVWITNLGRGIIVMLTGFLFIMGRLEVWYLFALTFLNSSLESFNSPASNTLFTQIVKVQKYEHATSLNSSGSTFAELIGYGTVGVLIGLIGTGGVIIIDAITFFISAVLILRISIQEDVSAKGRLTLNNYYIELKQGIRFIKDNRLIRSLCIFGGGLTFFLVPFSSLQPAYVSDVLNMRPYTLSIMGIPFCIALIMGGLLVPYIRGKMSGHKMFIIAGVNIGICYVSFAMLGLLKDTWVVFIPLVILCFVFGFSIPLINIPVQVAIFKNVDKEYLPRVLSFINVMALSSAPLGGALVGALLGFMPITTLLYIFGSASLLLFLKQITNKALADL